MRASLLCLGPILATVMSSPATAAGPCSEPWPNTSFPEVGTEVCDEYLPDPPMEPDRILVAQVPAGNTTLRPWMESRVRAVADAMRRTRGVFRVRREDGTQGTYRDVAVVLSNTVALVEDVNGWPRTSISNVAGGRCVIVVNRNADRLSLPFLQQQIARSIGACALSDYIPQARLSLIHASPPSTWWVYGLTLAMSEVVYPEASLESSEQVYWPWDMNQTIVTQPHGSPLIAFFRMLALDDRIGPRGVRTLVESIAVGEPLAQLHTVERFLAAYPGFIETFARALIDQKVPDSTPGSFLRVRAEPSYAATSPDLASAAPKVNLFAYGNLNFSLTPVKFPQGKRYTVTVPADLPAGVTLSWRKPGGDVWTPITASAPFTLAAACESAETVEMLLAVQRATSAAIDERTDVFLDVAVANDPAACVCASSGTVPACLVGEWHYDAPALAGYYAQLRDLSLTYDRMEGDLVLTIDRAGRATYTSRGWTHVTKGRVAGLMSVIATRMNGGAEFNLVANEKLMCMDQREQSWTVTASVQIGGGAAQEVPSVIDGSGLFPGKQRLFYTCDPNRRVLEFENWTTLATGKIVRVPYRWVRR